MHARFKLIFFSMLWCLITLALVCLGEVGQLAWSNYDVRITALSQWAGSDALRQQRVKDFTNTCLVAKPVKEGQKTELLEAVSVSDCAAHNGFDDVFAVVDQAGKMLKSTAWPLSLVAK